jgi:uncharacterized integral membrane protein
MADEPRWAGESKDLEKAGGSLEPKSRWTAKRVVSLSLVAILVVLVLQNTGNADVHLLLFTVSYPLWLVLGGMVVVSFLAGWLFGGHRARQRD